MQQQTHTKPTIINGMSIAKAGYRGVSVPVEQENEHQVETAALAGYLTLIQYAQHQQTVASAPNPQYYRYAEAVKERGINAFSELYPVNAIEGIPDNIAEFEEQERNFIRALCTLGAVQHGKEYEKDYWQAPVLMEEGGIVNTVSAVASVYTDSSCNEWPPGTNARFFADAGRILLHKAFNPWNPELSPLLLCVRFDALVHELMCHYGALHPTEQKNPRNKVVIRTLYASVFHRQAVKSTLDEAAYGSNRGDRLKSIIRDVVIDLKLYHERWTYADFLDIITRTQALLTTLKNMLPTAKQFEKSVLTETITDIHRRIRPHTITRFSEVRDDWTQFLRNIELLGVEYDDFHDLDGNAFTEPPKATAFSPQNVENLVNLFDPRSPSPSSSEESPAAKRKSRKSKRRQAKQLTPEQEAERKALIEQLAEKQREEEELRAAIRKKEEEERAEKKRIEDELRAAKKKQEEEQWAAEQKRVEEKRVMQRKMEQEAKALKKQQEKDRIQKIIDERNKHKKAEDERRDRERKEREERERVERERNQRERAEREERERVERERIQREKTEKEERERLQNKQLADAQSTILDAIARDPTKLDAKFMLKFMQTYAPSLVRFGKIDDDDTGKDPLMGCCQICFEPFDTTHAKKPLYLKCCAQSLCAGCTQKVITKPHLVHRLEFDQDDALLSQWLVMRRAMGLPVPNYDGK